MTNQDLDGPCLTLNALTTLWPETIAVFMRHKMLCVGCQITPFHKVIDVCLEYDLDERIFCSGLRVAIGK